VKIKRLHDWDLSYAEARLLQSKLAQRLEFTPIKGKLETVAGLDCAFSRDKKTVYASIIVLRMGTFEVIETADAASPVMMPYIPGLLSFRETPACIAAAEKLKTIPDLFIVDGQGIAHPRRLGIAAHLGLFFNKPTIGCAKSRLIGEFELVGGKKGDFSYLMDKGEIIGAVLRTKDNIKPVFVSPGNKCTLQDAIDMVLACSPKYRLPEPTRLAHISVSLLKTTKYAK